MTRRLVQLAVLIALALAPFGRIGASEAMGPDAAVAVADHCGGRSMPDRDRSHRMTVDCTIACAAAMAPAPAPFDLPPPALAAAPVGRLAAFPAGIHPEADPPPPRLA